MVRILHFVAADAPEELRDASWRGFTLAAEEADRAAALLGRGVAIESFTVAGPEAVDRLLEKERPAVVVGGLSGWLCERLRSWSAANEAPFLEISLGPLSPAGGLTYSIVTAAAREKETFLWHPSLVKYGAGELNERFQKRFDAPMESIAWASWIGVKAAFEAALRADDTRAIAAALGRIRIDGHKGVALRFRNNLLEQPLYRRVESGELEEVR